MHRVGNCHASVDHAGTRVNRASGKFTNCAFLIALISIISSGLMLPAVLAFAQPARANAEQPTLVNPHPHVDDPDLAALRDYARRTGSEQPKLASIR